MPSLFARLRLEALEDRCVPASLMWTYDPAGFQNDWVNPQAWVNLATGVRQAPANGDSLLFSPGETRVINGNAFTGTGGSSDQDIVNLSLADLTFKAGFKSEVRLVQDLSVTGTFDFRSGTVKGPKPLVISSGATFKWGAGALATNTSAGTPANKATVQIDGAGSRRLAAGKTLTLHANSTWTDGDISLGEAAKIVNEAGSSFLINGADGNSLFYSAGPGKAGDPLLPTTFTNKGTVTRNGGNLTASFVVDYVNQGETRLKTGTVSFVRSFTQTAGSLILDGGQAATKKLIDLQGGLLTGSGTVTGNVKNAAGTVKPGLAAPGTITIKGDYEQAAGGKYDARIDAGGTGSLLEVKKDGRKGGNASLAGTLAVDKAAAYQPGAGNETDLFKADAVKGKFGTAAFTNNAWTVGADNVKLVPVQTATKTKAVSRVFMPGGVDAEQAPTNAWVSVDNAAPLAGQAVTFTVSIAAGGSAPAQALLYDGATLLGPVALAWDASSGRYVGTYATSSLVPGVHSVSATLEGDDEYLPGWSSPVSVAVGVTSALDTTLALAVSRSQAETYQRVTLTADLSAAGWATGQVAFYADGTLLGYGTLDANGRAEIDIAELPEGTHAITAAYLGDARFEDSTSLPVGLVMLI
ncbi:MAG: Ig-like domain-containing protein [Gemmataceae bacterium]|nr:Ig-like domain-containing protein [Gemmataceae bacterium]